MFHKPREDAQGQGSDAKQESGDQRALPVPATARSAPSLSGARSFQNPPTSHNKEKERQTMSAYQNDDKNEHGGERQGDSMTVNLQRGAQTPPGASRIPGSYSSAYTGYGTGTSGTAASETLSRGRKLIVGEGISLSGEIDACDHLIVEGKVEAALKGASLLDVAETGVYYGTVEIEEAMIAGRFEGDLTVNGRLTIKSTGSITGAISYKELAVEAGAVVDGKISPLRERGEGRRSESGKAKGVETQPRVRKEQAVSHEDSLPFEKTVEAAE
jgi:cytoskeletal protein CcmA (bactofilin family)